MGAPMMQVRRSAERGFFDHGWLKTYHTFSFGEYEDPQWIEFGALRVINDDRVAAGEGFGKHGHRDMEILTYVLAGELQHRDSMGNGSVIRRGDLQRMSAGTGVLHSEFNPGSEEVHLLQIWITPDAARLAPGYEQRHFSDAEKRGRLRLIAARDGDEGAVRLNQDAKVYAGLFAGAEAAVYELPAGRRAWVHLARGALELNATALEAGDGAGLIGPARLQLSGVRAAEVLLFDLPA
jgi:quercetin 2,3-dioxygenase